MSENGPDLTIVGGVTTFVEAVQHFGRPPLVEQFLREAARLEAEAALVATSEDASAAVQPGLEMLSNELAEFLGLGSPQALSLDNLLETLAQLLLDPVRVPGEPCLAPAPLLRDLLDIALGRLQGIIGPILGKVGGAVEDFLFPAFGTAEVLADSVQAVLDDPITAALNLVLGQRGKIDCPVEGQLGVGAGVIEASIRRVEEALAGVLA